jgi:DsbE subfamily thiol:disulfide oxidoreductase
MMRWPVALPLVGFLALIAVFGVRLTQMGRGDMPNEIKTVLIDKPVPEFQLPALMDSLPGLSSADFQGKVTLVNFFASWCIPCRSEHGLLSGLKDKVTLVGVAYKNEPADARQWLAQLGNPYAALAQDRDGRMAIDFGLYGVPESYLIDKQGRIRYAWKKPFTPQEIKENLLPMIAELNK